MELLPRVLRRNRDALAICLVQGKFLDVGRTRLSELEKNDPELAGRTRLVVGDVTLPDLGLGREYGELARTTVEVLHFAAVYDVAVAEDVATRVNVEGTRHVTDFARHCQELFRYQYASTCYVSGRYPGSWGEDDLLMAGQPFANHYERTKHLAEQIVRGGMAEGIPTTIYRPSVVSGDSSTGATQKLDGLYFVAKLLLRQRGPAAVMPVIGDAHAFRFNFVPRDYVVGVIDYLSGLQASENTCYALADPAPPTVRELIDCLEDAVGKRLVSVKTPERPAAWLLEQVPALRRLVGLPAEALPYFTHPTHYTTTHTERDLRGTGITLPNWRDTVPALVEFTRRHRHLSSAPMV